MSAVADHPPSPQLPATTAWRRALQRLAGPLAVTAVTAVALPLGNALPLLGAPIVALVLGIVAAAVLPVARLRQGLDVIARRSLQLAIVALGATISAGQVLAVGASSLPVMLGTLATALLTAALVGRGLGVGERLAALVGVGTGICGASAIAAVSGVIDAPAREVRYAIATIFAFNLVAVLAFPPLGHLLGMSQSQFGLWAGTAVNDTSSVVAAGFAYGHAAGAHALIVKLTRTTAIVPITAALAIAARRRRTGPDTPTARRSLRGIVPWFLIWFAAASAADSLGLVGAGARTDLSHAGLALTALALASVGLGADLREMRRTGARPLLLGALVWAAVTVTSLGLQALTAGG